MFPGLLPSRILKRSERSVELRRPSILRTWYSLCIVDSSKLWRKMIARRLVQAAHGCPRLEGAQRKVRKTGNCRTLDFAFSVAAKWFTVHPGRSWLPPADLFLMYFTEHVPSELAVGYVSSILHSPNPTILETDFGGLSPRIVLTPTTTWNQAVWFSSRMRNRRSQRFTFVVIRKFSLTCSFPFFPSCWANSGWVRRKRIW